MRAYASISSKFWTGATGKKMRGKPHVQVLALYLLSCPQSNMIGLFYLPRPMLAYETGLTDEQVRDALAWLAAEDVAHYDPDAELVWIPKMVAYQVGDAKGGDKRLAGLRSAIRSAPAHRFRDDFFARYSAVYDLGNQAPSKPLPSPLVAPPKQVSNPPKHLQDQDQEQRQEQRERASAREAAPPSRSRARQPGNPLSLDDLVAAVNRARARHGFAAVNNMALHGQATTSWLALPALFPGDTLALVEQAHEAWLLTGTEWERQRGMPADTWLKSPAVGLTRGEGRRPRSTQVRVRVTDPTAAADEARGTR